MFCTRCGAKIPEGGRFCVNCGAPVAGIQPRPAAFQGEPKPVRFFSFGESVKNYFKELKLIFSPKTEAYKSVGSFITIGNIFPGSWDWHSFWNITAFLSVMLAVLNILPIPALDGGHLMFTLYEMITGRKPSDKFLEYAQMVGMILLMGLMVLAFGNDIFRLFN